MSTLKVDVIITNPDGQKATLSGAIEFSPAPSITSVSPISGPASGGFPLTITGVNFVAGASVLIGGKPAGSVVVSADGSTITAIAPSML
jgi:hypothetical protein